MQINDLKIDDCWNRIGVWSKGSKTCPELDNVIHCRNCQVFSKTGRRLLRSQPPEDYCSECTKTLAVGKEIKPVNIKSAFVFRTGSEWFALPAHMIQEVVNMRTIHFIPNVPSKALRGLINIHGRLQICVSIGRVLGIKRRARTAAELEPDYISPERLVVVLQESLLVAFPVTEAKGMIHYTPEMVKDIPVTISSSKAAYTTGILHLDGKDIGLLKDKPLFKILTKDLE